ncbi:MAG TPA: hypothetical protein VK783_08090 [Bacteroidia bacterium]|jgi:hypothetical protein|nr:hypothetical protein [Bacteroidia bacterium]
MVYLKCNKCGHLNEVRSENLFVCYKCNQALDNSFSEWKKKNPGATFEDFKKQVCISVEEPTQVKTKKSSGKVTAIIIAAVVLLLGGLGYTTVHLISEYGGMSLLNWFRSEKTANDVLTAKWVKESYGSYGLTLETPEKMVKGDLPMPDNVRQVIDEMDCYNYSSAKGFKVLVNSIKYKDGLPDFNLQVGANGAVNQMKASAGATDFNYTEERVMKDSIPGIIQHGTYKQEGVGVEFTNAMYSKGRNMWQVVTIYQDNDDVGRAAAKRVIESIEIKQGVRM